MITVLQLVDRHWHPAVALRTVKAILRWRESPNGGTATTPRERRAFRDEWFPRGGIRGRR